MESLTTTPSMRSFSGLLIKMIDMKTRDSFNSQQKVSIITGCLFVCYKPFREQRALSELLLGNTLAQNQDTSKSFLYIKISHAPK